MDSRNVQTEDLAERYLTTKEVAALLHVKERKIYDLAAAGDIPGTRALGKWLFERAAIDNWLAQHRNGVDLEKTERPNVALGSNDPLFEWAVRASGAGLALFLDGSGDGLTRFANHEGVLAGIHLLDHANDDWNIGQVRDALTGRDVVLVEWAWRQRGMVVPEGNPKSLKTIDDLKGLRVIPRQEGAGAQILLHDLMSKAGLGPDQVTILPPARSESDAALAVTEGEADIAFGLQCVARQYRLDFVPIIKERFDLLVSRRDWFEAPMQQLLAFTRSEAFAKKAASLTGYDISQLGRVRYNS